MKNLLSTLLILVPVWGICQTFNPAEIKRWKQQADQVEIIRDTWGVPHVYGKSDADAVFGLLYVQCEDDFERVEMNYINALGRSAEVLGEERIYHDLRIKLFNDTTEAIKIFEGAPSNIKKLMSAFADGINYFLYTHPQIKPRLLNRFKPWYPVLFSEGSIGGDIESISVGRLKNFYGEGKESINDTPADMDGQLEPEPRGSNGFAIAPSKSASGNALFLINPHTSFYFRSEVHAVSGEGLNAYGAVTWGQFFVYQGFNEYCGWMHTSSAADVLDEYLETIVQEKNNYKYKHGEALKQVKSKKIKINFIKNGSLSGKYFTAYFTHHGPVIARQGDKWLSVQLMQEPLKALTQSFYRTKSKSLSDFKANLELRTNSSNNTVYADNQGNIAYWHGNFMPIRNTSFDWSNPVDGSDPATDWKGLHRADETIQVINPSTGWIQNCNATPFTVSGSASPNKKDYPAYMAPDPQNARGIHAERVLQKTPSFTLEQLIAAAYDPNLPGFENLIPSLIEAFDKEASSGATLSADAREAIGILKQWDLNFSESSVPTTLAIYWGQTLRSQITSRLKPGADQLSIIEYMISQTSPKEKITALENTLLELSTNFGSWKIGWGEVNRFQRLTGKISETFDDAKPSMPVAFTSSFWGSLAAFGSRTYPGTKRMYGSVGNSFVAVVEFGKRLKAKSVVTGGSSSDPQSKHFNDQSMMYTLGQFKDILFYKEDVLKNMERKYKP